MAFKTTAVTVKRIVTQRQLTLITACQTHTQALKSGKPRTVVYCTSSSFVASSDASCLGDDGDEVAITYEIRRFERCDVVSPPDFSSAVAENT